MVPVMYPTQKNLVVNIQVMDVNVSVDYIHQTVTQWPKWML